uniref:Uncharacterized protein n=1 Tax=Psilocybe cubensis TaxID=181762 RepID=A0A8H8CF14_PSICU
MASSNQNPQSPEPNASIVKGYRIQRCSGESGGIPVSTPLSAHEATHATRSQSYSLTLNETGTARNVAQVKTLGEAIHAIDGVQKALRKTYLQVGRPHGDINPNVMLLNKHGEGVLVDWDNNYLVFSMMRTLLSTATPIRLQQAEYADDWHRALRQTTSYDEVGHLQNHCLFTSVTLISVFGTPRPPCFYPEAWKAKVNLLGWVLCEAPESKRDIQQQQRLHA